MAKTLELIWPGSPFLYIRIMCMSSFSWSSLISFVASTFGSLKKQKSIKLLFI